MLDENGSKVDFANFDQLSSFEIKDELIKLAKAHADKSASMFLNAGRGNPNWIATRARAAFFLLGQFTLAEAKHSMLILRLRLAQSFMRSVSSSNSNFFVFVFLALT